VLGVDSGRAFIRHRQTGKTDSVEIRDGNFTISGTVNGPEFCSFGLTINGMKDYYFSLFLEGGKVSMSADKDALNDTAIQISGGVVEKEFQRFQKQVSSINQKHYPQPRADAALEQLAHHYAQNHPDSYITAFAMASYENNLHRLTVGFKRLPPAVQRSYFGEMINNKLRNN
jgi:hypothetical protein